MAAKVSAHATIPPLLSSNFLALVSKNMGLDLQPLVAARLAAVAAKTLYPEVAQKPSVEDAMTAACHRRIQQHPELYNIKVGDAYQQQCLLRASNLTVRFCLSRLV